jgi:hypothetical protein
LFCHASLGDNKAIESFPVGRRLAFDAAKGRLWVVCQYCARWNLTPLEERWEAIEDCERRFRGTTLRVSTDNVGLVHLREGLDLVRIGKPLRPEIAAWRYGPQFTRRWRSRLLTGSVGLPLSLAGIVVAHAMFPAGGLLAAGLSQIPSGWMWRFLLAEDPLREFRRVDLPLDEDGIPGSRRIQWQTASLRRNDSTNQRNDSTNQWILRLPYRGRRGGLHGNAELSGDAALRAAGAILVRVNAAGAGRETIARAIGRLEKAGSPGALYNALGWQAGARGMRLVDLRKETRLALEMAAHDSLERRAAEEGDLAELETAWREAEEIAAIADDMFLPASVDQFLARHR